MNKQQQKSQHKIINNNETNKRSERNFIEQA